MALWLYGPAASTGLLALLVVPGSISVNKKQMPQQGVPAQGCKASGLLSCPPTVAPAMSHVATSSESEACKQQSFVRNRVPLVKQRRQTEEVKNAGGNV